MGYQQKKEVEIDPDAVGCGMFVVLTISVIIFYSLKWIWETFLTVTNYRKNTPSP